MLRREQLIDDHLDTYKSRSMVSHDFVNHSRSSEYTLGTYSSECRSTTR